MAQQANISIKPGRLFIDGAWVEAQSGATYSTINPTTEKPLTEVAEGGAQDIGHAVKAARKAFGEGAWPKLSPADRGRMLWKIGDL
ncbi:MAG TPA: aldehyde dehydrogenase family protein, partial [Candidatus Polarisedimenticolia bacterium]|nr:aldehyde dehydrogenase family protein [Candidatus Polarisedimenticolia bacterium]